MEFAFEDAYNIMKPTFSRTNTPIDFRIHSGESAENYARRIENICKRQETHDLDCSPSKYMIAAASLYVEEENLEKFISCLNKAYEMKKNYMDQENIDALKVLSKKPVKTYMKLRAEIKKH